MCKYCVLSLMVLFVFISFVKADLWDGLVLYLPFDEGEGVVANDSSANQFTGNLNGDPEWVVGKFGNALSFDGDGDYVKVDYDAAFDIKEGITVSLWLTGNVPWPDPMWRRAISPCESGTDCLAPWGPNPGPWYMQTASNVGAMEINFCFGGDDMQTLYITCYEKIYSIRTNVKGFKYPPKM